MIEKNKLANVWHIKNNELKYASRLITRQEYNNVEIAILKADSSYGVQEMLIKDTVGDYWELGIAPIKFKNFTLTNEKIGNAEQKQYCNDIANAYSKLDLKVFFEKKIKEERYFNKCELKYISKYYPDIYENAQNSRNIFREKINKEREDTEIKYKEECNEKVEKVNQIFNEKVVKIKKQIILGECILSENLEFYKDNKFENGITTQNCFLYLSKLYGIEIPLATQGFINNKLVNYNFSLNSYSYKVSSNKKGSTKIQEYMNKLYKEVFKEKQISNKNKNVRY